jgi:hypothetical protein
MFCPAIHSENDRQIGMKSFGNLIISFGWEQKAGRLSRCLAPMLAGAFLAAGCHKAQDVAPPPVPPTTAAAPDTNQPAAPVPGPPVPSAAPLPPVATTDPNYESPVKANGEPDLHVLDHAMLRWRYGHGKIPSSFAEFAASADVQIPPPPPGKMYALGQYGHVILVNATR